MDPLSVTITLVTFATFLKDVIELGQQIKGSVDKVGRNKKRLRELSSDVLHDLIHLEKFYQDRKSVFDGSTDLAVALGGLRTEMYRVHERCQQIVPAAGGGRLGVIKADIKAWTKRDAIEADIVRLKERVQACYSQFTAFASARIEHTLIVHRMEDRVRLSRMESLVARLLIDTHANSSPANKNFGFTTSVLLGRGDVEYQYLHLQIGKVMESLGKLASSGMVTDDAYATFSTTFIVTTDVPRTDDPATQLREAVITALKILCAVEDNPTNFSVRNGAEKMSTIASSLHELQMTQDAVATMAWSVDLYRTLAKGNTEVYMPRLALALHNCSVYRSSVGDSEGALAAIRDSVAVQRIINDTKPDRHTELALGQSLRNLSSHLYDVGHFEEALEAAQESVDIYRAAVFKLDANSITRRPAALKLFAGRYAGGDTPTNWCWCCGTDASMIVYDIALSLRTLSTALTGTKSYFDAYVAQQEALDIFSGLAAYYPGKFEADLAQAHYSFYFRLSKIGKMEDALASLQRAIVSFRMLARRRPFTFTVKFIRTLSTCATLLRDTGRDSDALVVEDEAVKAFRILVAGRPDLAIGLPNVFLNFSSHLQALGRRDEAMAIAKEAVSVYRPLMCQTPEIKTSLASKIYYLGLGLQLQELCDDAFAITREALDMYRSTPPSDLKSACCLVEALNNFSIELYDAGYADEAVSACEEAIKICQGRVGESPEDYNQAYANVYDTYASILYCMCRYNDALAAIETTTALYRAIPSEDVSDLPFTLAHLSLTLLMAGRSADALPASDESEKICLDSEVQSKRVESALAYTLYARSKCLAQLGHGPEALAAADEAMSLCSKNHQIAPHMWRSYDYDVASNIYNFSTLLAAAGRFDDALAKNLEAAEIYRNVVITRPGLYPALATVIASLSNRLWEAGRQDEAIATCEELVTIRRRLVCKDPDTASLLLDAQDMLSARLSEVARLAEVPSGTGVSKFPPPNDVLCISSSPPSADLGNVPPKTPSPGNGESPAKASGKVIDVGTGSPNQRLTETPSRQDWPSFAGLKGCVSFGSLGSLGTV